MQTLYFVSDQKCSLRLYFAIISHAHDLFYIYYKYIHTFVIYGLCSASIWVLFPLNLLEYEGVHTSMLDEYVTTFLGLNSFG